MTSRYQPQGWGPFVPGRGVVAVEVLASRVGLHTVVELADGSTLDVYQTGGSRDFGEEWEHVYLSDAPPNDDEMHFVMTSEILRIVDPSTNTTLYDRAKDSQDLV